jgi:DNA primase
VIPDKIIEDIRDRTDIVQVIGGLLDLRKAGRNFKAHCPFHSEKTPSFMVSPQKQIYHCFGCGKGGNVFHFLMEYEGISFVEAVDRLGKDLGVDISRYLSRREDRGRYDPYYRAMEFAGGFYARALKGENTGGQAKRYLRDRDLGEDLIEEFGIGYAPSGWDHLYRAAMEAKISRDVLLELNLIMRSRGGSGYRDYFRNRLIFPISTLSNRIVGFAGRVLDRSEPKYLNSMESPIYSKGKILYGLNQSKEAIRKSKAAIIVEGYMDYLTLWANGIRNLCAVCGTSLTEDQARLLARYTKRVYIINDGDRAGIRAAVRAADQLVIEGVETQIVILPEDEDPDSIVRSRGADHLRDMMRTAPDYFSYLKGEADSGSRKSFRKNKVVGHLLETVSRVGDGVRKELYLQEISDLFEIPVDTLKGNLKAPRRPREKEEPEPQVESKRKRFQKELFRIGMENEIYARKIIDNLLEEDFEGVLSREFYKALDYALKNHIDIQSPEFVGAIEDPELCNFAAEIALLQQPPGPIEDFLDDTIVWLKKAALRVEMDLMKRRIAELQAEHGEGTTEEELEIAEAYRKVAREYKKLGLKEGNQSDES